MNQTSRAVLLILLATACLQAQAADRPYDGSWESLQKTPVPARFDDGKIGIFIHWGPYSAIGYRKGGRGYSENVPKMFYADASRYYPWMRELWGATPPEFGYKGFDHYYGMLCKFPHSPKFFDDDKPKRKKK